MAEALPIGPKPIANGPWAGWMAWGHDQDPFEDYSGPFYFKEDQNGRVTSGVMVEPRHMNGGGFAHGGFIMTFIDYAMFALAYRSLQTQRAVTVECGTQFVGMGSPGSLMEATGEVIRETRSMIFLQGKVTQNGEIVAGFSGTLKKIGAPR